MYELERYWKNDRLLVIYQDTNAESPRDWDNIGKTVFFHKRYNLGDEHGLKSSDFDSWDELEEYLYKELKATVVLPVYLYDHSGLRIKVGSFAGMLPQGHARFDSGQIGFIYSDSAVHSRKMLEKILRNEIETYDQYLRGDIAGYQLFRLETCNLGEEHEILVDSCWGFYDMDHLLKSAGIKDITEWRFVETCYQSYPKDPK
jgi:hypothetical protein